MRNRTSGSDVRNQENNLTYPERLSPPGVGFASCIADQDDSAMPTPGLEAMVAAIDAAGFDLKAVRLREAAV
jgi:hypothetical protein